MAERYVLLQPWSCGKCDVHGQVETPVGMEYSELKIEIGKQHAELNPECHAAHGVDHFYLTQTFPLPD